MTVPMDAKIAMLVERLNTRHHDSPMHAEHMMDEAAAALTALQAERDRLTKDLRTVQNAAKTLHHCRDTELHHLRDNAAYDHRMRAEHESLQERDAMMTDALLQAEAERDEALRQKDEAVAAFRHYGQHDYSCVVNAWARPASCSCGYSAALAKIEKRKEKS